MTILDWALVCMLGGIVLLVCAVLWQMSVMLTETYSLDRYANTPKMMWVAMSLFFSFGVSVYWVCPNARKKGVVFALLAVSGVVAYGVGMYLKQKALSQ